MKKRIVAIMFCLLMVFMSACGEKENNNKSSSDKQSQANSQSDSKGNSEGNKESDNTVDDENDNKEPDGGVEETASDWNSDGALKILAIGNSFSADTMQHLYSIASNSGVNDIVLGNLYIGGCSLLMHANNAEYDKPDYTYHSTTNGVWKSEPNYKISTAIASENWDFISLQQVSDMSGMPNSYNSLAYLVNYLNKIKAKDTKIVWNMTWAYQADSGHSAFVNYNRDQLTMYNSIVSAVKKEVVEDNGIEIVAPAGTAIQNARTSFIGDTLTRDGYHLSHSLGCYIAGLAFFHELTGISIENLTYAPGGVNEKQRAVAIESAINAVKNPYEVTTSAYQNS